MTKTYTLKLTEAERRVVILCLSGEVENDDGRTGWYFNTMRRVLRKLDAPKT